MPYLNNIYRMSFTTKSNESEKSKSAYASGYIDIVADFSTDIPYISSWYIYFNELAIDLCTTPSWFITKPKNFRQREKLFKTIRKTQLRRKNQNFNNLYKLSLPEITWVNDWFNKNYDSSIKNIISILKGNNAGGTFKDENHAEMFITNLNSKYNKYKNNLIMFLDLITMTDYIYRNEFYEKQNYEYRIEDINLFIDKINNYDYIEVLNLTINDKKMSLDKRRSEFSARSKVLKYAIKNRIKYLSKALKTIDKERSKVSKFNINVFEKLNFYTYENAHILDVSRVKANISSIIKQVNFSSNKKDIKKAIEKNCDYIFNIKSIADKNNLLNLPVQAHRWFDDNYFTYNEQGECYSLKKDFNPKEHKELQNSLIIKKDEYFKDRIKYIKLRNQSRNYNINK
ncbi:MAG4270 family putative restriction endonuclease [Mycoplasma mycoides]|uniref:Uncharacterized protein n=1 Tax=Mycoplasma mycoides subsp. capri TaxID=40477 RepID=Q9RQS4_MYCMC|nr:hypothetical protein [Mycoplasma mycoides]AAF06072.1 unknown [Mycoplasma mycoides subsp. capri]EXU60037.1 hypothetical protein MMC_7770 [Mycoplasma mycoides subsp. capri PG3]QVK04437.1 hypothetical protein I7639_00085 [Mycoplasma mycoides subsp. capri]